MLDNVDGIERLLSFGGYRLFLNILLQTTFDTDPPTRFTVSAIIQPSLFARKEAPFHRERTDAGYLCK